MAEARNDAYLTALNGMETDIVRNMFKVNNRNTRCRPGAFVVNFEYI